MTLIDPALARDPSRHSGVALTGTTASLGILMGHVFRRSSGRAWRLRRRSMELWPLWSELLSTAEEPLILHTPLVQLAASEQEADLQQRLAEARSDLGLAFRSARSLASDHPDWPAARHGGLLSQRDGRVDPLLLQQALRRELAQCDVALKATQACRLGRHQQRWRLDLKDGSSLETDQVVICTGLASQQLLAPLGHARPLEPVLGQVLQLRLNDPAALNSQWPAVLVSHGVNLVRQGRDQLWLGATLEPGSAPDHGATLVMRRLEGDAPEWLRQASVVDQWYGLRARPSGRPAPLLDVLEPGLILASGHYRNGVLLAPATAEWVTDQIPRPGIGSTMLTKP